MTNVQFVYGFKLTLKKKTINIFWSIFLFKPNRHLFDLQINCNYKNCKM